MNDLIPTQIVDKNGKKTTVRKKPISSANQSGVVKSRIKRAEPPRGIETKPFLDDPSSSFADLMERSNKQIGTLFQLLQDNNWLNTETNDDNAIRLNHKLLAFSDACEAVKLIAAKHEYLGAVKMEAMGEMFDRHSDPNNSEGDKQGYQLMMENLRALNPVRPAPKFGKDQYVLDDPFETFINLDRQLEKHISDKGRQFFGSDYQDEGTPGQHAYLNALEEGYEDLRVLGRRTGLGLGNLKKEAMKEFQEKRARDAEGNPDAVAAWDYLILSLDMLEEDKSYR